MWLWWRLAICVQGKRLLRCSREVNSVWHSLGAYGRGSLLPPGEGQDEGTKVAGLIGPPHPSPLPEGEGIPVPDAKIRAEQ